MGLNELPKAFVTVMLQQKCFIFINTLCKISISCTNPFLYVHLKRALMAFNSCVTGRNSLHVFLVTALESASFAEWPLVI